MDDFRRQKKTKKRKELGKKRDKSDRKKVEIGSIRFFMEEKVCPLGPSKFKKNMRKKTQFTRR
jgi:hypothetical protein